MIKVHQYKESKPKEPVLQRVEFNKLFDIDIQQGNGNVQYFIGV